MPPKSLCLPPHIALLFRCGGPTSRTAVSRFLLGRTCFFFHKVWRADEPTGFVAWAFAAGRLDILELKVNCYESRLNCAYH